MPKSISNGSTAAAPLKLNDIPFQLSSTSLLNPYLTSVLTQQGGPSNANKNLLQPNPVSSYPPIPTSGNDSAPLRTNSSWEGLQGLAPRKAVSNANAIESEKTLENTKSTTFLGKNGCAEIKLPTQPLDINEVSNNGNLKKFLGHQICKSKEIAAIAEPQATKKGMEIKHKSKHQFVRPFEDDYCKKNITSNCTQFQIQTSNSSEVSFKDHEEEKATLHYNNSIVKVPVSKCFDPGTLAMINNNNIACKLVCFHFLINNWFQHQENWSTRLTHSHGR